MEKTDNELIAEFMGWTIDNSFPDKDHVYRLGSRIETKNTFRFQDSWDWLMPVVEKIEADDNWVFTIFSKEVWLSESEYRRTARGKRFEVKGDSKIGAVYTVVVQYIKWYSQPPRV